VLLAQAGIHPGEIDGKDAGMMLLRDIAFYGRDDLLDRVNLILIPILSVDGHERRGPIRAPTSAGPASRAGATPRPTRTSIATI
jgi:murein tripeptide amidase MpaA